MLKDRRFPAFRTDFIFGNKPFSAHPANSGRDCSYRKIRPFAFFTHRNYAARRFAHRTVLTVPQKRSHKPEKVNQLMPQHKHIFFHIIYIAAFCKKRQFLQKKFTKKAKKSIFREALFSSAQQAEAQKSASYYLYRRKEFHQG